MQDVRYASSGDQFASVGSDSKAFLYDGKTGDVLGEFAGDAHKGTIVRPPPPHSLPPTNPTAQTALSWSPDNTTIATSSADTTVKLWDVETRKCTTTIPIGAGVPNQQVGTTYTASHLVSLSLSGVLSVLDPRAGRAVRALRGPQKAVTAAAPVGAGTFVAGTADGRVLRFEGGEYEEVAGEGHTNLVAGLAVDGEGKVVSVGYDDTVREISGAEFACVRVCQLRDRVS